MQENDPLEIKRVFDENLNVISSWRERIPFKSEEFVI